MRLVLCLLLVLVAGCSKKNVYSVDPQIQPYVDAYVQEASKVGQTITVNNLIANFGTLGNPDWAGQCVTGNGTPTITLSTNDWSLLDSVLREELVFHELGHCVLFREHNNDLDANGIPVSIMYWTMSSETVYKQFRADWLVEMFWYQGPGEAGSLPGTTIN